MEATERPTVIAALDGDTQHEDVRAGSRGAAARVVSDGTLCERTK
jgi:hypothetical protein